MSQTKQVLILGSSQHGKTSFVYTLLSKQYQGELDGKSKSFKFSVCQVNIRGSKISFIDSFGEDDTSNLCGDENNNRTYHYIAPYLICYPNDDVGLNIEVKNKVQKQIDAVIIFQSCKAETIQLERTYTYYQKTFPQMKAKNIFIIITKSNPKKINSQEKIKTIKEICNKLGLRYIFWQNNVQGNKYYSTQTQTQQCQQLIDYINKTRAFYVYPHINEKDVENLVNKMKLEPEFAHQINEKLQNHKIQLLKELCEEYNLNIPKYNEVGQYRQIYVMRKPEKQYIEDYKYDTPVEDYKYDTPDYSKQRLNLPKQQLYNQPDANQPALKPFKPLETFGKGFALGAMTGQPEVAIVTGAGGLVYGFFKNIHDAFQSDKQIKTSQKQKQNQIEYEKQLEECEKIFNESLKQNEEKFQNALKQQYEQRKRQIEKQYQQQQYLQQLKDYEKFEQERKQNQQWNDEQNKKSQENNQMRQQWECNIQKYFDQQKKNKEIQEINKKNYRIIAERYIVVEKVKDYFEKVKQLEKEGRFN